MVLRHRHLLLALLITWSGTAAAQLALPGATAPAPVGSVVPSESRAHRSRLQAVSPTPVAPLEAALAGKTLRLDGSKSQMAFAPRDKTVELSRLLLAGTKVSNTREECQVDVAGLPLPLTAVGKDSGLLRFSVPVPACPIQFDVLDGAVLVSGDPESCTFREADCVARPGGLWGPGPGDIGPDQVKVIERERTEAERKVRAAYQGLVASTKDRTVIRGVASEQAGFSSRREEQCRDYIGEARHGFCASRLTQARAVALQTELAAVPPDKDARKTRARK